MSLFGNMKLATKMSFLVGVFLLGFLAFALVSHRTLETVRVKGPIYDRVVEGKDRTNSALLCSAMLFSGDARRDYTMTVDAWSEELIRYLREVRARDPIPARSSLSIRTAPSSGAVQDHQRFLG